MVYVTASVRVKKKNVRNDIDTYSGQYRKGLVYIERITREWSSRVYFFYRSPGRVNAFRPQNTHRLYTVLIINNNNNNTE